MLPGLAQIVGAGELDVVARADILWPTMPLILAIHIEIVVVHAERILDDREAVGMAVPTVHRRMNH